MFLKKLKGTESKVLVDGAALPSEVLRTPLPLNRRKGWAELQVRIQVGLRV
jgi:hypothetical protein